MHSHPNKHAPIAIYDSGVGGLAIASAIQSLLPQESIHYIGDTKNLPYGEKGSMALCGYVREVVDLCLRKGYKLLVMACNTATAAAAHCLPAYLKTKEIAVINVIDPVISYLYRTNRYKKIGLIGTKYTVASGIYTERLRSTGITLTALATPLLVPMVNACFNGEKVDYRLVHYYLSQLKHLDAVIPACTHYLFLSKTLKSILRARDQKTVEVIDAAGLTALAAKQLLTKRNLLSHTTKKLPDCFMATALTTSFQNATQQLFGQTPIAINLTDDTESGG
ncbi:MAG: glutamate racemase [Candidatus Cardinium sp.]|uniref:glutamate racemase n=1 Tax=Candidatus Cardinium sp. TP TaxID=2961955 RepID=UPI0021AE4B6A|nr:glutamate racemase [Candidatus Cardinium sp. TP]MCT4697407.1 glutamate racemase [Candidatus Cardinium sp. TP]MDN5247069.1 glutamate racemase [Candidatus Cardinium sp.]